MADFPKGFLWDAASASYQIEGGVNEGGRGTSMRPAAACAAGPLTAIPVRMPAVTRAISFLLLPIWFHLSDPAAEDAIYDSCAMRKFTGIDFLTESVPDEAALCKFLHLLEEHGLNKLFFEAVT